MKYIEVFNNLKKSINEKGLSLLFDKSIKELRANFSEEVSTKFLRGLSELKDSRKRTNRITYLLRRNNLKTNRVFRFYKVRGINKYKTDVITWGHDKKSLPFDDVVYLTAEEEAQLKELKNFKEATGIELFNHTEQNLNDRQKTRNAFNYGGGAVVRDVKVVKVGSFAVMTRKEVLYLVC